MPNLQLLSARAFTYPGRNSFHCPTHGDFKVADTVLAKAKDYTREQWEAALDRAEERAEPDEGPLIIVDDFY